MTDIDNPNDRRSRIPFQERPTCTVAEACKASGIGRSKLYELMGDNRLKTVKVDKRRLIVVPSLLDLLRG